MASLGPVASGRIALGGQVVLATALPWLAGGLTGPARGWWPVAVLAAVTAFAVVQRRLRFVWLLPGAALVSLSPVIVDLPPWAPVLTAVVAGISGAIVLRQVPSAAPHGGPVSLAVIGWTVVAVGVVTGALAVAATSSSDAAFEAGQSQAAEAWDAPLVLADPVAAGPPSSDSRGATATALAPAADMPVGSGDPSLAGPSDKPDRRTQDPTFAPLPVARLSFTRPDADTSPVTERPLYVGADVTEATLTRGPGHYPTTALPGAPGNFAVAGHRTGWGSPFFGLDELRAGDRVRVTDRAGAVHVYVVDRTETVDPRDSWVLGPDPLGTGSPTLTLTTCDPPGVNDRRLVVFATLRG